jgi:hypothetical protein
VGGASIDCMQTQDFCDTKWCWVDPDACVLPYSGPSGFFSNVSYTSPDGEEKKLYYSYETCGISNYIHTPFIGAQ